MTRVPRSTLSDIETGKVGLTLEVAEQIAKGLHITITELFESEYK